MRFEQNLRSQPLTDREPFRQRNSFWNDMLSDRALRAMRQQRRSRLSLEPATAEEARPLFRRAAENLTLASEEAIGRILAKNPDILFLIRSETGGAAAGLFTFLPLNEFGAAMLVSGRIEGSEPDPAWVTRPRETPAAIYVWLFYGPNLYFRSLESIGEVFSKLAPQGCAVFSRGATTLSESLQFKLGYQKAKTLFPEAPEWLLVALPSGRPTTEKPSKGRIEVRQVRSFEELAQVFSIRSATYIAEQFPLYQEEFDGNDFCATHFVAYVDGDPAGAVRIRYFADFTKLERLAVKLEYRQSRTAFRLCKEAIAHIRRKGFTRIYGHASDEIAPFWKHLGGRLVPGRSAFTFASVEYREMYCELEPDPLAIRFGAPPMVTIRPEGHWDEPSPLDWSNVTSDPKRMALLQRFARLRTDR